MGERRVADSRVNPNPTALKNKQVSIQDCPTSVAKKVFGARTRRSPSSASNSRRCVRKWTSFHDFVLILTSFSRFFLTGAPSCSKSLLFFPHSIPKVSTPSWLVNDPEFAFAFWKHRWDLVATIWFCFCFCFVFFLFFFLFFFLVDLFCSYAM